MLWRRLVVGLLLTISFTYYALRMFSVKTPSVLPYPLRT
nr:MAG TPA: vacuolar ATP synthase subunit S1 [Caudoviricetes sp.]